MSAWHWQVGHAAVALKNQRAGDDLVTAEIVAKQVYRVADVMLYKQQVFLQVAGQPGHWNSRLFRPVQPATDQFKKQLAAMRPRVKQSQPA